MRFGLSFWRRRRAPLWRQSAVEADEIVIRIAITNAAFEAIAAARCPWRTPGESYSDVILRLVEVDANGHRLFVRVQSDVRRGFLCNPRLIVRRFLVEA